MKVPDIDQTLSLSWRYALAYLVIAPPTLWLTSPWTWDLPFSSKAIGCVLLPAIVLILFYFPILFVVSVAKNYSRQKQTLLRFILALTFFIGVLILSIVLGFGPVSAVLYGIAGMSMNYLLHPKVKSAANQPPQPTRASGPLG